MRWHEIPMTKEEMLAAVMFVVFIILFLGILAYQAASEPLPRAPDGCELQPDGVVRCSLRQ